MSRWNGVRRAVLGLGLTAASPTLAQSVDLDSTPPAFDALSARPAPADRRTFAAPSAEIHPSAVSAALEDTLQPREAVLDRLASPYGVIDPGGAAGFTANAAVSAPASSNVFATWGQAFGSFGHIDGNGAASSLDRSMGGFVVGADATVDDRYRLGVQAAYSESNLDATGSSGQIRSPSAGVYGGASLGALQLSGGASYAYNRYGESRTVGVSGFSESASSGYGGDTLQAFGEAGWRVAAPAGGRPAWIEPFVGAFATRIETASFAESGGAIALEGSSASYGWGATTLGARAATLLQDSLSARGMLGWQHAFGNLEPGTVVAFESAPADKFTVYGVPIPRDALLIEAGFDWRVSKAVGVGLFYLGSLSAHETDNAVKGKFDWTF